MVVLAVARVGVPDADHFEAWMHQILAMPVGLMQAQQSAGTTRGTGADNLSFGDDSKSCRPLVNTLPIL